MSIDEVKYVLGIVMILFVIFMVDILSFKPVKELQKATIIKIEGENTTIRYDDGYTETVKGFKGAEGDKISEYRIIKYTSNSGLFDRDP